MERFDIDIGASMVAQMVKNLPAIKDTQVQPLGQEDPLKKRMATYSSILAWRIPWLGIINAKALTQPLNSPKKFQSILRRLEVKHDFWWAKTSFMKFRNGLVSSDSLVPSQAYPPWSFPIVPTVISLLLTNLTTAVRTSIFFSKIYLNSFTFFEWHRNCY